MSEVNGKYVARPGLIPGVPVNLSGHVFVLAPLGLRLAREFAERGKGVGDDEGKIMEMCVDLVLASVQRNYPEVTREVLEPLLDTVNVGEACDAIRGASGLVRVTPGEPKPPS